ncbi:hypothetical protein ACLF3G_24000 [Falsiroseomonas sp. HC035]|uniref:hypothetical protein n=1 Tax=Falsiroseomonas sp. HC035 TaxID=3390999 RepID=UPI003D323541
MPLFAWAAQNHRVVPFGARLQLRADLLDAEGEPRACITIPGQRIPLAYPNIGAALTALRTMEAAHACR